MAADLLTTTASMIVATTTKCTKHLQAAANGSATDTGHNHDHHAGHMMAKQGDGSMTMNHGVHDMGMSMSFHFGIDETILFDFWKTDSIAVFLLSCAILFVMAALYEGLKLLREKLIRDEIVKKQHIDVVRANAVHSACHCTMPENRALLNKELDGDQTGAAASIVDVEPVHDCCKNKLKSPSSTTNQNNNSSTLHTTSKLIGTANGAHIEDEESKLIILQSYRSRLLSQAHIIQTCLHMLQITVSYLLMLVFMTYNTYLCLSVVLGAGFGYFVFGLKRLTTIDVNEHCH